MDVAPRHLVDEHARSQEVVTPADTGLAIGSMKTVTVSRYLTPLREGGSLPAVVEADDSNLYVLKFRGAGHGAKALIAEVIVGELARAAGLRVPELVRAELDPVLGRNEPDPEIRDLINASAGPNLGLAYLAGAIAFDPIAPPKVDPLLASQIVWLDALVLNVDRSARNPNLLIWNHQFWLIDHGAALYFHHDWRDADARVRRPFPQIKEHVLLPQASELRRVDADLGAKLTVQTIGLIISEIPEEWLAPEPGIGNAAKLREAYQRWLVGRLQVSSIFISEAERARANLV